MKQLSFFMVLIMMLTLGHVSAQEESPRCETVGGTFTINFVDETTGVAALTGDLNGAVRGIILEAIPNDDGSISMQLEHTVTTESGNLILTKDEATLSPVHDSLFLMEQVQTIAGGTGRYSNSTGTLTEFGAVDMASGQGVLRYSGEICGG